MKRWMVPVFLISILFIAACGGGSSNSSGTSATSGTTTAPTAPTGVSAACGANKITVSWTASSGATSYKVYRSTASGGAGTLLGTATASPYDDTTGTAATAYYYTVKATNSAGDSAASSEATETFRTLMGGSLQGKSLALTGAVTLFAGQAGFSGMTDGAAASAKFSLPQGITTDDTNLYVADYLNNAIRQVVLATGAVSTLAGSASGASGSADGAGTAATFFRPYDITNDGTNLYVTDYNNRTIRKIVIATGAVTTLAGQAGTSGTADGTGAAATFSGPKGITTDGTNLWVVDVAAGGSAVRRIVIATGVVTTFAGNLGSVGHVDGVGTAALFNNLEGITTDGTSLYVTDRYYNDIRKIDIATAAVSAFVGDYTAYPAGYADGAGTAARFNKPMGITTDGASLYVTEYTNQLVRKVDTATGAVTTLAGTQGSSGTTDGTGAAAKFSSPHGIVAGCDSLFVAEYGNSDIRRIR